MVKSFVAQMLNKDALQRAIPDISQKMLSVTLRTLEEDGYLTRQVYPEVPPRVEYALSALGCTATVPEAALWV